MSAFKLFLLLFILCVVPAALAQDDCPALITAALDVVDSACSATARNQLCYGNITLNATPRPGIADFHFEQSGDLVGVADVETLQLSSFDLVDAEWGVALMKVQANLPDTVPGQNVTFLLFGDVSMADAGDPIVEVPVTATSGVNVRQRPTTSASVIESLQSGQEVIATGRLSDSTWIRVRLDDASVGWVFADFLNGGLDRLPLADPLAPAFGPMQAFYFTTGVGDAPCQGAPSSGILIQTPEGAGTIQLRANNVDIRLGSTVYLQAAAGDAMYVNVLEGHALLTAQGGSQIVPAGTVVAVPLDDSGAASGPPEFPEPYITETVDSLPVQLLPDAITIAAPLTEDEVETAVAAFVPVNTSAAPSAAGPQNTGPTVSAGGLPPSGVWALRGRVTVNTCDPESIPVADSYGDYAYPRFTFSDDHSSFFFDWGEGYGQYTFQRTSDTVYVAYPPGTVYTITFTSPTTYFTTYRTDGGCLFYMDENGFYVGP